MAQKDGIVGDSVDVNVEILEERGKRTQLRIHRDVCTVMKQTPGSPFKTAKEDAYHLVVKLDVAHTIRNIIVSACQRNLGCYPSPILFNTVTYEGIKVAVFSNVKLHADRKLLSTSKLHADLQLNLIVWKKEEDSFGQFALLDLAPFDDASSGSLLQDAIVVMNHPCWTEKS